MLDFSYAQASPIVLYSPKRYHLYVVGLGGSGSAFARPIACIATSLQERGNEVTLTFIDPDRVEAVNIPRQHFYTPEIGMYKVEALAARCSDSFPLEVGFIPELFEQEMVQVEQQVLTVVVGCVDRAEGRVAMEKALDHNEGYVSRGELPRIWYLDLGNGRDYGQIALGSTRTTEGLKRAFRLSALGVSLLPSPLLQYPALRDPLPEERTPQALSCAELLIANRQSLFINPKMAIEAAVLLNDLLLERSLKRFSVTQDLPSGTVRSRYTTREHIAAALEADPNDLFA